MTETAAMLRWMLLTLICAVSCAAPQKPAQLASRDIAKPAIQTAEHRTTAPTVPRASLARPLQSDPLERRHSRAKSVDLSQEEPRDHAITGFGSSMNAQQTSSVGVSASLTSMSSEDCMTELRALRVPHRAVRELKGVETPVEITGAIGPVSFWVSGGGPLLIDCRLALRMAQLRPVFEAHGVTRMRFSGAYVYRNTRAGRLSHHAHGLALDIHEITIDGRDHSVRHDFARRGGCSADAPALNRLTCALSARPFFEELLTPDSNADHHDHLHWAVSRGPLAHSEWLSAREEAAKLAAQERIAARLAKRRSTVALEARENVTARQRAQETDVASPTSRPVPGSLPEALPLAPSLTDFAD